ncbi:adenosylcobinamide-GDP ribazoletransferase [Pseudomonas panipatensis]|uniref:Adenosylcobinamide-GDP ribazoletransferase n=1 Tax=Pseudomonas panipatensis TaxID=428992 RepID=A0A1G8BZ11_9PSED|nr:adenosylcobinamide-GDP ribazoletransferase [Pseudomonas panipatensis]SDH38293.1 cobalamin-5'-phosphate synthase [Pseudomonas panipatensis]SMP66754.1 cobalamin-5'-phosphate synthase [Pseudomonas panipatensis]
MSNLQLPLIALQFLTRLPVRLHRVPTPEQFGRAILFYPLVGLLMGAALCALGVLLSDTHPLLQAALLLTFWVGFSGALHLDGLADTADAWVGGLGDRERTLAIMKDPRSGPIAVVALVLILLLKFAALVALLSSENLWPLLLAPWLARVALPLLFYSTPYARPGGLGQALADHLPRRALPWVLAANAALMPLTGLSGALALVVALVVFIWWRSCLMTRLDGTTGDTAGALVELTECAVLVALAI